jgi:CheY-like chemotaxis protein
LFSWSCASGVPKVPLLHNSTLAFLVINEVKGFCRNVLHVLRSCPQPRFWATFFRDKESQPLMTPEILLVDDNDIQAATRKAILARSGHSVAVAQDGYQALQLLEEARAVRLVITDHLMPRMKGPQFVAELRRRFPHLPVLVLSGLEEAEEQYVGLDVLFRVKPLPPDELLALTRSLLISPIGRTA